MKCLLKLLDPAFPHQVVYQLLSPARGCGAKKIRAYCAVLVSSQGPVALVTAAILHKSRRMADPPIVEGVVEEEIILEDPCLHQVRTGALSARHGTFAAHLAVSVKSYACCQLTPCRAGRVTVNHGSDEGSNYARCAADLTSLFCLLHACAHPALAAWQAAPVASAAVQHATSTKCGSSPAHHALTVLL